MAEETKHNGLGDLEKKSIAIGSTMPRNVKKACKRISERAETGRAYDPRDFRTIGGYYLQGEEQKKQLKAMLPNETYHTLNTPHIAKAYAHFLDVKQNHREEDY